MTRMFCYACLLLLFACQPDTSSDKTAILAIMQRQTECWNQGDLNCFMEGYWHADSLMFIGRNGITYGYEQTLARYRKNYPDQVAMGQLTFDILSLERLSADAYYMVGKWMLRRQADNLNGHFTLLFRKIDDQWFIVKDHSS